MAALDLLARQPWPTVLDQHERAIEADCAPIDDTMRGQSLGPVADGRVTRASLALGNVSDRPSRQEAMSSALALFAAHGRATRLAMRATADWFDPPKFNLLRILYEYAWATRECRDDLPHYRARALTALRSYRALRAGGGNPFQTGRGRGLVLKQRDRG